VIEYVFGDLFSSDAQALAHGCNCLGVMGAGIAAEFKERYPEMYQAYRRQCLDGSFGLGSVMVWVEDGKQIVFNLGTQPRPGRCASYEAMGESLGAMKRVADDIGVKVIAIPRIGTGHGGLEWSKVKLIVEEIFELWAGVLYVYSEVKL